MKDFFLLFYFHVNINLSVLPYFPDNLSYGRHSDVIAGLPAPGTSEVYLLDKGKPKIAESKLNFCFPNEPVDEAVLHELYNRCEPKKAKLSPGHSN